MFAEVSEAAPISAPIPPAVVSSTSFFDTPAIEEEVVEEEYSFEFEETEIVIDRSKELPRRPQTADGTFGDDLDIPEFLRG